MKFIYIFLISFLSIVELLAINDVAIETSSGTVYGVKKNKVIFYEDIPYAQPPTGELRWKAPRTLISSSLIKPKEVVRIQLTGLMNNDNQFQDSGIEQTWNFAHPDNKKNTGPLPNFKIMIKGRSYQMLLNHLSHTITELGSGDKWAQFEVIILDKDKIYHKFNWQVEKYTEDGPLKDCWLTTVVSSPVSLGSSI